MNKTKTKRTGISLRHTVADCPRSVYVTLGFTEEQASRMMAVRRILPIVENRREPIIDARKLWEAIGRPESKFADWISRSAGELFRRFEKKSEVSQHVTRTKGRPRIDYLVSRDLAAQLAMMANTDEGQMVREYFLDMEEAIIRLARHQPIRANLLVQVDNELTYATRKQAGIAAKEGLLSKQSVPTVSLANEKRIKSLVCRILTGHSASEWKGTVGRSIRNSLNTSDLELYSRCYDMAVSLFRAGCTKDEVIQSMLAPSFADRIKIEDYLAHATD